MSRVVKLEELCLPDQIGKYGIPAVAEEFSEDKVRYLRITDIDDYGNLLENDKKSVSSPEIEKYILKEGDIVFARTGNSTGRTYFHEEKNGELAFAGFLIKFSLDESKVNPKYLKYFTISKPYKQWVDNLSNGSTRGNINAKTFADCPIILPSREQQDYLVRVLSSLEDKIQINNQINQELEAMAKTLYDYWFVQFDFPDQNGKPYKSSGGKMVYNPELKREIPEGWGVEKLGDVAYLKAGGDKPNNISDRKSKETPIPIYSNGLDNKGLYGYTNKATIYNNSLTVSARGTIGYVQRRFSPFFPIIRLISITPKEEKLIGYIENFLKSIQFENSGSVQQQLTVPQIDKLYIVIPENKLLEQYHSLTINYYCQVENNEQQNQQLTQLRDWLLPMLMNGQVKVE